MLSTNDPASALVGFGVGLSLIKTFAEIFGQRYGEGTQAPEAGVRVQTLRVASYIDDQEPDH